MNFTSIFKRFIHDDAQKKLGWILLSASFVIGYLTLEWGSFIDEADNIAVGVLLDDGYVLYRDIFSHHFPLPYYWIAFISKFVGISVIIARLSVLVFQIISFAIGMKLSQFEVSLGLTSLIWNILKIPYKGNMVLYTIFCAVSLVVIFSVALAIISRKVEGNWRHGLLLGLFSIIALMSDPLSIYAILIVLFFLITRPSEAKIGIILVAVMAIGLSIYLTYLIATNTLIDFVRDTIFFNLEIYSQYLYTNPMRLNEFTEFSIRGLDILSSKWFSLDPMKPISTAYSQFDSWLFTGFLYRLSIILLSLWFFIQKKYRGALFAYFFGASLLVISEWDFRSASFVIVSIFAAVKIVSYKTTAQQSMNSKKILLYSIKLIIGFMTVWLLYRTAGHIFENSQMLSYKSIFRNDEELSQNIVNQFSCNHEDVFLAYYPGNPYIYFFTNLRPVSKYMFMWPWVADVGLSDVIMHLDQKKVVVYIEDTQIWGKYNTKEYLSELITFLDENYYDIEDGWYISPKAYQFCQK